MTRFRNSLSAMLGAAALAGATLAPLSAVAATKVVLLYTGASSLASVYVAKDQGIFAKNGLDVDLTLTANGSNIPAALAADSAQIGIPTPTVLLQANDAGLDLVIVGGAEEFPTPTRLALVARTGSGIEKAKDFAGKKIGVPGINGVIDLMTRKWIAMNGGAPTPPTYVEVSLPSGSDTLQGGQVDAVATMDPFSKRIQDSKGGYVVGDLNSVVPAGAVSVTYVSARNWTQKNPEAVAAFRRSLAEANVFALKPENLDALRQSISTYTKIPRQIVDTLPLPPNLHAEVGPAGLQFWVDLALEYKMIAKAPDMKSLFAP